MFSFIWIWYVCSDFLRYAVAKAKSPSYLEKMNNGAWRVSVPVPRELVKVVGKTRLKRALNTHSEAEANRKKHAIVAEFFALIEDARKGRLSKAWVAGSGVTDQSAKDLKDLALDLRAVLRAEDEGSDRYETEKEGVQMIAEQIRGAEVGYDAENDEPEYDPDKERKAGEFLRIALGTETPLDEALEKFHSQTKWNARTKSDSTRAMAALTGWCNANRVPLTVEAITRKRAGQFIGDMASDENRPLTNRTVNKYLSCLARYWQWMEKRGLVPDGTSPWKGQSLPKEEPEDGEEEREFTDDEMRTLFRGEPNQSYLKDVMLIGALTGARIDAIIELRKKDITDDGNFRFKPQKREKSARLVPIHSSLGQVVLRLTAGKEPDDDLFPECPPVPEGKPQERSSPASKAFTYYRRSKKIIDTVEGKRRDRVNFHSFRRWFITKAFQADQAEIVIQKVVGQKPQSVAANTYLGGLTQQQLRDCVEAVRLPEDIFEKHEQDQP